MTKTQLALDIFAGKAGKKVLFQPRIECWYGDKTFLNQDLPGGLKGLNKQQMYKELDVSNRIYDYGWNCFEKIVDPCIKTEEIKTGAYEVTCISHTPIGDVTTVLKSNTSNPGMYYKKYQIENTEDLRVKTFIDEATDWKFSMQGYNNTLLDWGDIGAPTMYVARTPYQEAVVETLGVENTAYMLADEEKLAEKYFDAVEERNLRLIREINKSPIQIINYGDNIHCAITPPYYIEKYILPIYEKRRPLLKKAGKFIHAHWDGDVKSILKYLPNAYLDGIEALTPFPQGDVSVEEIKDALGNKLILLDGIAALLFNDNYPISQLIEQVNQLIEYFAGRLILGISDEMPSLGNIERVRLVRDIVNEHNKKLEK